MVNDTIITISNMIESNSILLSIPLEHLSLFIKELLIILYTLKITIHGLYLHEIFFMN
jgi:hypothetical protein